MKKIVILVLIFLFFGFFNSISADSITSPDSVCGNGICENERCEAVGCNNGDELKTCPQDCGSEIKITPEKVSEISLQKLQLKSCNNDNNCSMELEEIGENDDLKLIYKTTIEKEVKILGLFLTKMKILIEVRADNGEVIRINMPWWSFLTW